MLQRAKNIENIGRVLVSKIIANPIAVKAVPINASSTPYEREALIVKNAVAKRKNEFFCGRNLLRSLLNIYGFPDCEILRGNLGEPLLPDRFIGSISHHESIVVGVLMPKSLSVQAIGIDIVGPSPIVDNLLSIISSENEKRCLFSKHEPLSPVKVIFSIKESVVKILSPLVQRYINLQDIVLAEGDEHIIATYKHRPELLIKTTWSEADEFIISFATLKK